MTARQRWLIVFGVCVVAVVLGARYLKPSHATDPSTRATASGRGLAQDSAPRAWEKVPRALPVGLHRPAGRRPGLCRVLAEQRTQPWQCRQWVGAVLDALG